MARIMPEQTWLASATLAMPYARFLLLNIRDIHPNQMHFQVF